MKPISNLSSGADQNAVPGAAAVDGSSGSITRGVLYLNASGGNDNIANLNSNILTIVLAHEIGHMLGLGHSTSTNALMYYDASAKTQLALAEDDMDGMSYLYPSNELSNGKIAGCGFIRYFRPPSGPTLGLILAFLFMPIVFLFFLRSRFASRRITP